MRAQAVAAFPRMERQARMKSLMDELWFLERDLVSDGFDQALERLGIELPLQIHSYPSGMEVWTWIVPEKWTCREAYVERLNGERILDRKNHPLYCASYSMAFEGIVRREELLRHLHISQMRPDAIPYAWKHYKKDWGLCCTAELREKLTDEVYRVVIRSQHEPGLMKVGEAVARGSSGQEIVLCAHLDHPAMANDDLSGVVVGMEVMRQLMKCQDLRYTYRLLLTPETIGSVAWLSRHEDLIPKIKGGLFLEMLGTDCPHALQMSFDGNTEVDQCFLSALQELDPHSWHGPFRRVIGNDERQFNAPGVRIPMLSLSRVFHPTTGKWPYPEYHSSADTPEIISFDRLERSVDVVLRMIDRLEQNVYPVNLFRGEVFCSRYGMFVDFYEDPEGNRKLFELIQLIDGTRTVSEIASICGASFRFVMEKLQELERYQLVHFSETPVETRKQSIRSISQLP